MRALELFAGIGGFSATVGDLAQVVGAIDLSSHVLEVLRRNFPDVPTLQRSLEQISIEALARYEAELWWMSPPCQPYTVRGLQRDLEDHRAQSLLHLLDAIATLKPRAVAMENVQGFWDSQARQRVLKVLKDSGYEVCERLLCPSELGVPARRERYYLVASREGLLSPPAAPLQTPRPHLRDYLDEAPSPELVVSPEQCEAFAHAMRIFDWDMEGEALNCFTSAYGKTFRYSGAFVREASGEVRYFSPAELLRFLHFPEGFTLPEHFTLRQRYKYVGNSLSVVAMREVLRRLPGLESLSV